MARTEITTANFVDFTTTTENTAGLIVEDATYTTLTAGTANGVEFAFFDTEFIILKNDTGGAAVFTIVLEEPTGYSQVGVSFTDKTVSVATGKNHVIMPDSRYMHAADKFIKIDCDVAGKILVAKRYQIG